MSVYTLVHPDVIYYLLTSIGNEVILPLSGVSRETNKLVKKTIGPENFYLYVFSRRIVPTAFEYILVNFGAPCGDVSDYFMNCPDVPISQQLLKPIPDCSRSIESIESLYLSVIDDNKQLKLGQLINVAGFLSGRRELVELAHRLCKKIKISCSVPIGALLAYDSNYVANLISPHCERCGIYLNMFKYLKGEIPECMIRCAQLPVALRFSEFLQIISISKSSEEGRKSMVTGYWRFFRLTLDKEFVDEARLYVNGPE